MKRVLIRTVIKGLSTLVGILVISTALQYLMHVWGGEQFIELKGSQSEAYPAPERDEPISKESMAYINEFFYGRPFIPDLWPFDNVSFWQETKEAENER